MLKQLLLLVATTIALPASAATETTGDLMDSCKKTVRVYESQGAEGFEQNAYYVGFCTGFLASSRDFIRGWSGSTNGSICMPQKMPTVQAIRVFVGWADKHPEKHHEPMTLGVISAMRDAFPCPADQ